jgi:hypothetical protein
MSKVLLSCSAPKLVQENAKNTKKEGKWEHCRAGKCSGFEFVINITPCFERQDQASFKIGKILRLNYAPLNIDNASPIRLIEDNELLSCSFSIVLSFQIPGKTGFRHVHQALADIIPQSSLILRKG